LVDIAALTVSEHSRIYRAVRDRDEEGARKAMQIHLMEAEKRLGLRDADAAGPEPSLASRE